MEDKKSAIEFHQHTIINLIKMIKSEKAVVTGITTTFINLLQLSRSKFIISLNFKYCKSA
ncbi:hypothetical protein [uncultured Ruminococcus sp.]|uniref:hypothetical protein n=1 Tax=uncultured Ruminococcus sp. TaxID=165186 RepID=UPI002665819D|nr:hypothetical protein [uncultured Ruminococcus sp.]